MGLPRRLRDCEGRIVNGADDGAGAPDWREVAGRLALALGLHRTDMHVASRRPCATCRYSETVLDEYLAAVSRGEG